MSDQMLPEDIEDFIAEMVALGCTVVVTEVDGQPVIQVPIELKAEQSA